MESDGKITDTVLHWIEKALGGTGAVAFLIIMFALFLPLSFLIPSTSGLATLSMPIMVPLASFLGVSAALVITAVVLGGTSLFGGRGGVLGTLVGAVIVGVFRNGLTLVGVEVIYQYLVTGVLIILAVSIDQLLRRRRA